MLDDARAEPVGIPLTSARYIRDIKVITADEGCSLHSTYAKVAVFVLENKSPHADTLLLLEGCTAVKKVACESNQEDVKIRVAKAALLPTPRFKLPFSWISPGAP